MLGSEIKIEFGRVNIDAREWLAHSDVQKIGESLNIKNFSDVHLTIRNNYEVYSNKYKAFELFDGCWIIYRGEYHIAKSEYEEFWGHKKYFVGPLNDYSIVWSGYDFDQMMERLKNNFKYIFESSIERDSYGRVTIDTCAVSLNDPEVDEVMKKIDLKKFSDVRLVIRDSFRVVDLRDYKALELMNNCWVIYRGSVCIKNLEYEKFWGYKKGEDGPLNDYSIVWSGCTLGEMMEKIVPKLEEISKK